MSIEIKTQVTESRVVDVLLSEKKACRVAIDFLCKKFNLHIDYFLETVDGKVLVREEIEHRTSHSWFTTETVREATQTDIHVLNTIHELRRALHT